MRRTSPYYSLKPQWLKKLLAYRPPSSVVQCGVGYARELTALQEAMPGVPFHGFEPSSYFVKWWSSGHRKYPGKIYPYGLWSEPRVIPLYRQAGHERTSVLNYRTQDVLSQLADCLTFDQAECLCGTFGKSMFLWMDCEGAEGEILKGAESALKRTAWISTELSKEKQWNSGFPSGEFLRSQLDSLGFAVIAEIVHGKQCDDVLWCRKSIWRRIPRSLRKLVAHGCDGNEAFVPWRDFYCRPMRPGPRLDRLKRFLN